MNKIFFADNMVILPQLLAESVDLIYIDPPFNTHKIQRRGSLSFGDSYDDFPAFIEPRLREAYRILKPTGSLFFHLDYREIHYCKVLLDQIFGRRCFINEIIWAYDYGGRSKKRWSAKHDTILWYAKDPRNYTFNFADIDRVPYMAPGLVGAKKAAMGKTLTDVWWHTIVPTNSREKTGYPTQKPLGLIKRIIKMHSKEGELVLDFFAGSGTTGLAAHELRRRFILIDNNYQSIDIWIDVSAGLRRCNFTMKASKNRCCGAVIRIKLVGCSEV
jgi:site-specific DNA-methyltransferase (adenine-specific)